METAEHVDPRRSAIELAILRLREEQAKIRASFARIDDTARLFQAEYEESCAILARIQAYQESVATACFHVVEDSVVTVQRVIRGFLARRLFRHAITLKAALTIQRAFRASQRRRAERLRRFRALCRKVLRGLRSVKARHDLTHTELLDRVGHNMMIERQWRLAMGIGETDSDLMNALYRRKFMRRRIAELFRSVRTMLVIIQHWRRVVPPRIIEIKQDTMSDSSADELAPDTQESMPMEGERESDRQVSIEQPSQTSGISPGMKQSSSQRYAKASGSKTRRPEKIVDREELRRRQRMYTQRIYEENMKRETARAAFQEQQQRAAELAKERLQREEQEQRQLRFYNAQALREDLERRGLLAIRDLQSRKELEVRKEEAVQNRVQAAKTRIAASTLSDETRLLLARKK
ncbi:hypothetical protein PINS_up008341 [Pythium insidiosum]|nr:hypothetical protein PINS_up008341 [Pythium insidiosum]